MMKILKLDKNGHSTLSAETGIDIDTEFKSLVKSGYAMFVDDVQVRELPTNKPNAEIFALAPLVGG